MVGLAYHANPPEKQLYKWKAQHDIGHWNWTKKLKIWEILPLSWATIWFANKIALSSTSVQGWIRNQLQHPVLQVVLIETSTSLAKEQYTIYSTVTPIWNSLFGIDREHPKQEILFKANQSYLP